MRDQKTRLSYWFPLIEAAGLPVPKTRIHKVNGPLFDLLEGKNPDALEPLIAALRSSAVEIHPTGPWFLRTDYTSGKHEWDHTCYLRDLDQLGNHIGALVEFSELVDFLGLPHDTWVIREMLPTTPMFRAFAGMPIVREFRIFVRDGVIEHRQPYWPPGSIVNVNPHLANWASKLAAGNVLSDAERAEVELLALRASHAVPGYWSVDLLETSRGWYVTDMAEGERSYRWEPTQQPSLAATSQS